MTTTELGRYRRTYVRIWRHPGFLALGDAERNLSLYALTGPQTNRIGLFVMSPAAAAEDLGMVPQTLTKRLANVCRTFGWRYDKAARVIWIPSWWKWNPPENVNVLKGNLKDLSELPSCALLGEFANHLAYLPETFHQTFREALKERYPKPSPNQEQEQEQEQEEKQERALRAPARLQPNNTRKDDDDPAATLAVARETLKLVNPERPMEELVDAFQDLWSSRSGRAIACSRADASRVLKAALSERSRVRA
jgi:hypothetical protein